MKQSAETPGFPAYNPSRLIHLIMLCAIGLLFATGAVAGITHPDALYPTADLYNSFLPNDYVDLCFGMPVFLLFLVLALRKLRIGLIGLGSALLFILYNSVAYLFAAQHAFAITVNAFVVLLCVIELGLYAASFPATWRGHQPGAVQRPELYGVVLAVMGVIFVVRALSGIIGAHTLTASDIGVNVADAVICSVWIVSGVLLLIKGASGPRFTAALVAYVHGSLLFIALLLYMALQPALCGTAFEPIELTAVALMSLLLIVPCALLLRRFSPRA